MFLIDHKHYLMLLATLIISLVVPVTFSSDPAKADEPVSSELSCDVFAVELLDPAAGEMEPWNLEVGSDEIENAAPNWLEFTDIRPRPGWEPAEPPCPRWKAFQMSTILRTARGGLTEKGGDVN